MIRNIGALLAGLFTAFVLTCLIEMLGHAIVMVRSVCRHRHRR